MTYWLDAQLDPELAAWLGSRFGIIVKTLSEIGLRDEDDTVIFEAGRRLGPVVIITKDADFRELLRTRGAPPQVIRLRCGNISTLEVQALLSRRFGEAATRIEAGENLIEIA